MIDKNLDEIDLDEIDLEPKLKVKVNAGST
jgi:hypothetical protein